MLSVCLGVSSSGCGETEEQGTVEVYVLPALTTMYVYAMNWAGRHLFREDSVKC